MDKTLRDRLPSADPTVLEAANLRNERDFLLDTIRAIAGLSSWRDDDDDCIARIQGLCADALNKRREIFPP